MKTNKYQIKVYYSTGNSFGSHDTDEILELTWTNLDVAKENLKRIEEHYRWYEYTESHNRYGEKSVISEPEWHKGIEYRFVVVLKTDEGKDLQMTADWCGYFESLSLAEIIAEQDELKVYF